MDEHPYAELARMIFTARVAYQLGISFATAWKNYGKDAAVGRGWIEMAEMVARMEPAPDRVQT